MKAKKSQQGAVLIFSLVFLTILTLVAISGMDLSVVEERMAGNMQDFSQAFQAAEVALEEGEEWLTGQINIPVTSNNGTTTVWTSDSPDPDTDNNDWWTERDSAWWTNNAESLAGVDQVATQPQYIVEQYFISTEGQSLAIGTGELNSTRIVHRLTARGVGNSGNAEVLLQSTHIRPYD
ncbi:MAG: PilX N-terminal domain-containing pilus assembly protein [Gammaproteobacteria bacterium]|nr:PilX N-terminal domain-containing pilus assembly protein [Gammaproteobacteria bacterium]